jgi:tetratricopeptide (TPR) repeat protein
MAKTEKPTGSGSRLWLFAAMALTFGLRLWFILRMRGQPFSTISPQFVDSYFYHKWAVDIISGNFWGSDVFFLRPLYPYLLALFYAVFGQHVLPVQLFQVLLATASCFFLHDSTRRMFGTRPAHFAAFGFALTGILVFYTGTLLYVEVTVFLSLLFLWLILTAGERVWVWILAGLSFGLLVICRPEMLLTLPFLLIWLWRKSRVESPTSRVSPRGPVVLAAVALAVVLVVPIRNYIVARDPVLFTAHSGINFYYGNNPAADGTWQPTRELEKSGVGFSHDRLKRASRVIDGKEVAWSRASAYWTSRGLHFIFSRPVAWLKLEARKLLLFLANYEVPNDYYPETVRAVIPLRLAFVNFGLVLGLGLLGMFLAWPLRRQALPTYLFVAACLISSLAFYVLSRLRAPVLPFLLAFAGYGLSELPRTLKHLKVTRNALGLAAAVAVSLGANLIPLPARQQYSAQAWTLQGNILLNQKRPGPAVAAFRRALTHDPANYSARYSLVLGLAGMGRTAEAEAEYSELARIARSVPEAEPLLRLAAARLHIARRDFPAAASAYRAALASDPEDPETSYMLGLVYISMDSLPQAREWLSRATGLDPGHEAARSALQAVESRLVH